MMVEQEHLKDMCSVLSSSSNLHKLSLWQFELWGKPLIYDTNLFLVTGSEVFDAIVNLIEILNNVYFGLAVENTN